MEYGFVLRVVWCKNEEIVGYFVKNYSEEGMIDFTTNLQQAHIFCENNNPSLDYQESCCALEEIEACAENNILLTPCMINIKTKKNYLDFTENW